jgi:hypothetical protein
MFEEVTSNTSCFASTNFVVVVCGGDVVFFMEDVVLKQRSGVVSG